jgi:hypothetical protein
MGLLDRVQISYPDKFAALGRFIAKKKLSDVCVMEFESGVIVVGSVLFEAGESYNRRIETHVLSQEELQRLVKER